MSMTPLLVTKASITARYRIQGEDDGRFVWLCSVKQKGTGAEMRPAIVCGIVTRNIPVSP